MARLHDANEVLPVYNKRPGKVSQVPRRRKSKGEKKDDIPVDPRKIEAKLALRDLARESNARIGETLANFEDFVRKDKRFLRSGKTGDAYQAASEAFEDAEFLFTEVDRITDEQVDSMEEMNKWFNNNIEEGSLMEAEFLDAEEESKGLTDLLETSERVKMDYLYTAANAGNNMKKIFGNVKKAAEDGVKNAVAHAEQHVAEMEKHKKEKRRLQIIGALHHHRATKNTAGAAEPFEEKEEATKGPKPNVKGLLGAASKFKTKKKVKEPEVEEREPEESDLDYYNRTRKDKIVSESEEEEEEVVEEEDDEFKELLDQIATMKAEMDELKKQKKEDETKVKMAEAKVDQLTQKFAAYRQDTDNKEVNFRRQKASLNEQLMRESTRAREKELEERAKFEAETFIHKSANRKGAEASEIKEKALRKEIHGLQDKLQKLIVVKEKQDEELEELRIEVAKPKIEPEEYERVCQLQRETDDALAVLQTEFGQFKIDAAQEKKMLEQKIFDAQEETEKERQKVQETLKRALAAEKQVENLEKEVKNLEQKLIEAEEEKIRAVAEERERGEKLLAEQVLKTEAETARADAAEEEVERLEAEIEDLKIQHAKEVEKLTNRIETLEHEVDVLKEFATDIMGSAIELTSKGGEQCRVIIEEHYRADKLKKYIEVGNSEPDEEAILDSSKLDGMPIVAEILHVAVDLTSASHADVEEYGKLVSDFDSGKSLRDLIFAVENTTAVKTGLIEAPESTKAIDKRLEESQKSIDKCRVRLATSGDITADKAKKYIKAGIDTAMTALISNKTDRAANRVQIRDDARKLAKEKAEALLACLRGDREEAYAHADSLATPLVQTSQLLHRLRYYLETSWEDEKEDADVLIAEVHKLESNNVVRKMVGECFDLALPKLKKKPVNDLVALIIQRRNIVRSIRLGRVDDPPLKPEKIKKLNNNLKAVVEKMSKLRASMKSMVDVSDEHFDWYFPFMGKLEHTDDMLGLVDRGEQHEAKRLEIGGEIEKIENAQNGVLGELQKHRTKKSAERVQSRNVAIAEKVEKTKALIESLELGVERRNGAITITLDQIKLLKKALTDHSILLQKLKVHAGSHGKIHERGKLVAAAHKLELESTIVTSIVGPCIDLRAAEKKIIKILRDTQMVVYENMLRLSYETDEKEREAIKSSLEKGFETVRKSKSDFIRSGGMCDLMDEENATRDQENDVQQHLNAEADLATLTLQLQLDPGSQSLMEQVQLATNNVESLSMTIVKRRQSLAMVLFDFEDEEAKKPSPLQLERDALKVKLEATETEYEQSKVTWEGEKTTLTEDLSETKTSLEEAMKELMRLQATDIDTVLDNQSKERFALAMLSFKIEDAIRYLSRQAPLSAESSKPQIPSKKNMWIANRTKVQNVNVPEGVEVKERDQSDLTPPLVSKEVQTLLKHIEKNNFTIGQVCDTFRSFRDIDSAQQYCYCSPVSILLQCLVLYVVLSCLPPFFATTVRSLWTTGQALRLQWATLRGMTALP
jgi:hypothetical protein